ncbi:hypothetical protein BGZ51_005706 [Haplosporangium sp. Z 767]|nr:hypothetical protein BGZ51_005706 [Haplosporangium sp. Z 767]KAF9181360.1 hypothetical protein BGZ50_005571 [Haplosporangium sp. Z 11]
MKSFTAIAISVLALASQATAQMISYSQPVTGTQWTAGKPNTVSWINKCPDTYTGNKTLPITLNQQVNGLQVPVPGTGTIGYLDCSEGSSTTVDIPASVPSGNTYSILTVYNGVQSYSALFTIVSTIPGPSTTAGNISSTTIAPTTTTAAPTTTLTTTAVTSSVRPTVTTTTTATPSPINSAGMLNAGSTIALAIVAAVASLMV